MGQITNPAAPGIKVLPVDRQTGPSAGPGNTGNLVLLFGANAGTNNVANQVIVLGNGALAGGVADATLAGTIVLGVNAFAALTTGTGAAQGANIAVGRNAGLLADFASANILIGDGAMGAQTGTGGAPIRSNIVIGVNAAGNINHQSFFNFNVIIGDGAVNTAFPANSQGVQNSVVIGSNAMNAMNNPNNDMTALVVIGTNAGQGLTIASNNCTMIGDGVGSGVRFANNCVMIGGSATNAAGGQVQNSVSIGDQAHAGNNRNVIVGATAGAGSGINNIGVGAVLLGYGAGSTGVVNPYDFLCEFWSVGTSSLLYGNFVTGNLIIGNNAGANRDLSTIGATNAVKIVNGTRGAGNPIGGGFLYSLAGALHWVDTAGVDNLLSIGTGGQLAASSAAYTNNAGAQVATITNGPTVGNPTKWIPINDNGTIRNVPAW